MDNKTYLKSLEEGFKIFVNRNHKNAIEEVYAAIIENKSILPIAEGDKGSFFSIFLDFHSGTKGFQELLKGGNMNPKLKEFCILAGKIEGLTDMYPLAEEEPSMDEKEYLAEFLKEFLEKLPTEKEFKKWLVN